MSKISEEEDFLKIASDVILSNDSMSIEHPKEFPHSAMKSKEQYE